MSRKIIFVEIQCRGLVHSVFNASLITFVVKTTHSREGFFFSEKEHRDRVNSLLDLNPGLEFREIALPATHSNKADIILSETIAIIRALWLSRKTEADVFFLSVTTTSFLIVKCLSRITSRRIFVTFHGMLERLAEPENSVARKVFKFRWIFNWLIPRNIVHVFLTGHIKKNVVGLAPRLGAQSLVLEPPFSFEHKSRPMGRRSSIVFLSAGVASVKKGSELFFSMVEEVSRICPSLPVEFLSVGRSHSSPKRAHINFREMTSSTGLVEPDVYESAWIHADFVVLFYPSHSYKFTLSGIFLDAIKYRVPIIAIRNEFFTHCFSKYGELGWLCASYDQVVEIVIKIGRGGLSDKQREIEANFLRLTCSASVKENEAELLKFIRRGLPL